MPANGSPGAAPQQPEQRWLIHRRRDVVVYYLDDQRGQQALLARAPTSCSGFWGRSVELIPLTTIALQKPSGDGPHRFPAHYWKRDIPPGGGC